MTLCRDAEGELINPFHAIFGVETCKIKSGHLVKNPPAKQVALKKPLKEA